MNTMSYSCGATSSCLSLSVSPSQGITTGSQVALSVPYLYRKRSGIYQVRYRRVGSTHDTITVSMRTSNRNTAMKQQGIYNSAIKTFIVNHPDAEWEEMREYLRELADSLLTDKPENFWDGVEVSVIDESREALIDLVSNSALSVTQHKAVIQAQEILSAAQERLLGDGRPLLAALDSLKSDTAAIAPDVNPANLRVAQGVSPVESTQQHIKVLTFDELYQKFLDETSINMAKATISDHNTIRRRLSEYIGYLNMLTYTRDDITELRTCLMESGNYADASINKILQKLSAVVNWGLNNGLVQYDYTKGLKLKGAKSKRRAFTDDEMNQLIDALPTDKELTLAQQWAIRVGMITGARIGEILQLTKADIKETPEGITYAEINLKSGKTLKNAASVRCVPLTDGAQGFSLEKFKVWLERQRDGESLFKEDALTHIDLNAFVKRHTTDSGEVSFHSLRHYMATRARAKGLTEADIGGVLGHASGEITFGLYGATVSVVRSAEVLQAVFL